MYKSRRFVSEIADQKSYGFHLEMPQALSSPSRSGLAEQIIHGMHMGFEEKEFGSVSTGLADRKLMRFYPVLRNSYFEIINFVRTPLGGRYTGNSVGSSHSPTPRIVRSGETARSARAAMLGIALHFRW